MLIALLLSGVILTVVNSYLVIRANSRESLGPPLAFPIVPWLINVYAINQIEIGVIQRLTGYIAATTLELSSTVLLPYIYREWFNGRTQLHRAARSGNLLLVQRLLDQGVPLQARDNLRWSAVEIASDRGFADVVATLVDHGADIGLPGDSVWGHSRQDTLAIAASAGHLNVVKVLVEKKLVINDKDNWGDAALQAAILKGHRRLVDYLMDHSAGQGPSSNGRDTPLHQAVRLGDTQLIQRLLDSGADLNARGGTGLTPLDLAAVSPCKNRKQVVGILRRYSQPR